MSRWARSPGFKMDSTSNADLAPGSLAVPNSKVATTDGQRPGDRAKPQHNKGTTWFLALTALGIVYGDIGTSPLYAFSVALNATGHGPPLPGDVIGIVSLTFWALLLTASLKYVVFVLRADNDGEGGILALLALVASDKIADRARLSILVLVGVAGAALLYGDGVITPAISVLSAMEGLKLSAPAFADFIVPISLAILIALFAIQRRGTASIGRLFGPVMLIWFATIAVRTGRLEGAQSGGGDARCDYQPSRVGRYHRRRVPRAHRRRGPLRGHGSCGRGGDPAGMVRIGVASAVAMLFRPRCASAG